MRMRWHTILLSLLATWQDQSLLKTQAIYSARKKDMFPHLSSYQKSMDQSNIHLQFRTKCLNSKDINTLSSVRIVCGPVMTVMPIKLSIVMK